MHQLASPLSPRFGLHHPPAPASTGLLHWRTIVSQGQGLGSPPPVGGGPLHRCTAVSRTERTFLGMEDRLPTLSRLPQGPVFGRNLELPVAGRLSQFIDHWRLITNDAWVLSVVSTGYAFEMVRFPSFNGIRATRETSSGLLVLSDEVESLLQKRAVVPVPPGQEREGYYSTYFLVPKKDGGLRPILNLKLFNHSMVKVKFKMETLQSIIAYMSPGDWLASIDLKDAYFHVPVLPQHRKYLRFHWQGSAMSTRYSSSGCPPR